MTTTRFREINQNRIDALLQDHGHDEAMALAVGGDFEAVGRLELALLQQHGLLPDHTLIDVGCGSGRLALQLRDYLTGRYIGIDIVSKLIAFAQILCDRTDWIFHETTGFVIPEPDASADMVCFFALFTHIPHEESYRYLLEAARTLKAGGCVVFSFLEFVIPSHWSQFEAALNSDRTQYGHTQFLSRDAIQAWAYHSGLRIEVIHDGDKPHIALQEPIYWDDGRIMTDHGTLGQSICVLRKDH